MLQSDINFKNDVLQSDINFRNDVLQSDINFRNDVFMKAGSVAICCAEVISERNTIGLEKFATTTIRKLREHCSTQLQN